MKKRDHEFFVPPRDCFAETTGARNEVRALIDGANAMRAIQDGILRATNHIYVAGWWLAPEIRLVRDSSQATRPTLLTLLRERAQAGIDVRVMIWSGAPPFLDLGATEHSRALDLAGVQCLVHSPGITISHHQKIIVVDGSVAFIGGTDLTWGRWDTGSHAVFDRSERRHPGPDYYNSTLRNVDRHKDPRLPWHDIHCSIEGPAAFDVERNFVERWNQLRHRSGQNPQTRRTMLEPCRRASGPASPSGTCHVQVVRSLSRATGAADNRTERSLHDAYVRAIGAAEHFVYFENQFFISSTRETDDEIRNRVMVTLASRIIEALYANRLFVAMIVLPLAPEALLLDRPTLQQLHWQFRTINELVRRVRSATEGRRFPKARIEDVLSIHYLREHQLFSDPRATTLTEQVYVHDKLLIVDDRVAIIGSANVNDRSMAGDLDSEIGAIIIDEKRSGTPLAGRPSDLPRAFAQRLRVDLWSEHLGLADDARKFVQDPVEGHLMLRKISTANTQIYQSAFDRADPPARAWFASNQLRRLPASDGVLRRSAIVGEEGRAALARGLRGRLLDYPLLWLADEDLTQFGAANVAK